MKNHGKLWINNEIIFLKEFYPKYGAEYCSIQLKRGKRAIVAKAIRLKIKSYRIKLIYSKEHIEPIVLSSYSIREVLNKMNLRAAGGNYRIIKKYIALYNINTAHFLTQSERVKLNNKFGKIKYNLNELLIENSNYSRTQLKERLYKEGLKERKCELCCQGENWNGKQMSLILDHINGIHNDNRLENLRIVCPNCNATLDTHCGRNNKIL